MGDRFEAIVGEAHVERPPSAVLCGARVEALVRPANAVELAACLRAASESHLAVVPVGGGTKLGIGNPLAAQSCVRLELGRLCERAELDANEGIAELDAGVSLAELSARAAALGKVTRFGAARAGATVGGAIAADPLALESSSDVRLRDDLLGVEVALANGDVTRAGGRVVKNVTGFDLVRLYCGSLGTLAVITRAVVRLRAAPERVAFARARFASLSEALTACARQAVKSTPSAMVVVSTGDGAEVWSRFAGRDAGVETQLARALGDRTDAAGWEALRSELGPPPRGVSRVQLGARPSDVSLLCRLLEQAGGAGAVRLVLPLVGSAVGRVADDALPGLVTATDAAGASLTLERDAHAGPPPCDAFGAPPPALELMRSLKARFDPGRVLAPGRFVGGI
jgi:glycolate oxidase FAD binding subunit